ncbi:hypothetical protein [Dyella sp.]
MKKHLKDGLSSPGWKKLIEDMMFDGFRLRLTDIPDEPHVAEHRGGI